jgi:peroxiredoxin
MTTSNQSTLTTLAQQIETLLDQLAQQLPAEVLAELSKGITTLVQTGIAQQSVKVGERAPDFTLPDVEGSPVALSELLKQGPVVLTFYRGEWCPFCNLTLRAYQRILPQIQALGASLVAVSPQTPDHSLSTVEKKELTFPVLSDVGNIVARKYHLVFTLDQTFRTLYTSIGADLPSFNGDSSWELPMPATFLLAQDGTVRLAFVDEDFTHRLEPVTLLDGLRAVGSNGPMKTNR